MGEEIKMKDKSMPKLCWTCISAIDPHLDTPFSDVPEDYNFICEYTRNEVKFNDTCNSHYKPCPQVQKDFNSGCHL